MKAVSCETLQLIDRQAVEKYSLSSLTLMEIAGYESALYLKNYLIDHNRIPFPLVVFFIGSGNNGGDGLVMARHLLNQSPPGSQFPAIVIDTRKSHRSDLNRQHLESISRLGVPLYDFRKLGKLLRQLKDSKQFVLVDGLLGIGGVSRPPQDEMVAMISLYNKLKTLPNSLTLSLDIPSGIYYGYRGEKKIATISSDMTLTYGLTKDIFYYPLIRSRVGNLSILQPGFPPPLLKQASTQFEIVEEEMITKMILPYQKTDYKKTRGRILVVAGKRGMLGAATLTTEAAWKAGAGLVTLFSPNPDRSLFTQSLPHTMVHSHTDFEKYYHSKHPLNGDFDLALFGPGLGRMGKTKNILREILQQGLPVIIDADGIYHYKNLLNETNKREFKIENAPVILTPHVGEMRHLLIGIHAPDPGIDPIKAVEIFFQHHHLKQTLVVMKSHLNYILSPQTIPHIVEGNNPLLGIGGSGDVLAGIITALTARQLHGKKKNSKTQAQIQTQFKGAVSGCFIHQRAGKIAKKKYGIFTAKELYETVPQALLPFLKL